MSYCGKCGSVLRDGARFCSTCGVKQNRNNLMEKIRKISFIKRKNKDVQPVEHGSKKRSGHKKSYNHIIIGALAGLIALAVGFGSYYVCSSILATDNKQKADTYSKLPEKSNNNSNNGASATAKDKNQDNSSKAAMGTNKIKSKMKSSDDYIFAKSGDEKLLDSDLSSLNKEDLALARNEIFARHGYIFQTEPYKSYFNGKSWYKANSNFKGSHEELNDVEKYNVQLILKYEKK